MMSSFNWTSFLQQWSQAILESMSKSQLATLPQEVIESGWLGYSGATEQQICQTESRLGVKLPPSYREFLKVTDGWRQTTPFIRKLWSTEGIERFGVRHQKWIEAFTNHPRHTQVSFGQEIPLEGLWERALVTDEEYFVYGENQDCSKLRVEYLKTAIEISDVGEDAIYLLNPQVVSQAGEWEAWFLGDWLPGADRYPSFWEMMQAEYHNFLELHGAGQSKPLPKSHPLEVSEPCAPPSAFSPPCMTQPLQQPPVSSPESGAAGKPVLWRSLTRLTVEFQTRQMGEQFEYRTVGTAEGEPETAWSGLGESTLQQWLQEHLVGGSSHPAQPKVASVSPAEMGTGNTEGKFSG